MSFLRKFLFRPVLRFFVRFILPILFSFLLVTAVLLYPFQSRVDYLRQMRFLSSPRFRPVLRFFVRFIVPMLSRCALVAAFLLKPFWSRADYLRWLVLGYAGMRKVRFGELEKARRYANELLTLARNYENDWNYGNAVHKGNLILGRIALREEDISAARQFLRDAGKTPGSPQLDSFGPNMVLARELLEAGEKEVVLEYFELCGNFWNFRFRKLRKWSELVKDGQIPNFGPNLLY